LSTRKKKRVKGKREKEWAKASEDTRHSAKKGGERYIKERKREREKSGITVRSETPRYY